MAEAHEFVPFLADQNEDDSELASKQEDNRTKGGEIIHLTAAEVHESDPLTADQNEENSELASKQKDSHTKGGDTRSPTMTEIHELDLPFIDDIEDDSELASMQKDNRTKGRETIHLIMAEAHELVPFIADQNEDDSELASKQKDNRTTGGEIIHLATAEVHESDPLTADQNEDNSELASMQKDSHKKGGDTRSLTMTDSDDFDDFDLPLIDGFEFDSELDSMQMERLQWIKTNIKMRKCKTYIPSDTKREESFCKCGHPKRDHRGTDAMNNSTGLKWKCQEDTDMEPTNAYGQVKFYPNGNLAEFVRVAKGTNMSTMKNLMTKIWGMKTPNILISVTGGEGNFKTKSRLKHWFQRNLVEAARTTDAWIITGGTHTGVTKYVGDAFKDTPYPRVPLIGIVPWGVIHNRSSLQDVRAV